MKVNIKRKLKTLEAVNIRTIDTLCDFTRWAALGFPNDPTVIWNPIVKKGLGEFAAKAKERGK